MYICSHDTFLGLKIVKKGVLREWGFYFCLRFRRHFFLDIPKWVVGGFLEKYFWSWRSWKNVQVVSLYTCFRGFLIKNRRMCNNLKNALLPHFYVFLWFKKGICKKRILGGCIIHYWASFSTIAQPFPVFRKFLTIIPSIQNYTQLTILNLKISNYTKSPMLLIQLVL